MRKKLLLILLVSISFLFSIRYVYAEEENIMEGEEKSKQVIETTQSEEPKSVALVESTNLSQEEPIINNNEEVHVEEENLIIESKLNKKRSYKIII